MNKNGIENFLYSIGNLLLVLYLTYLTQYWLRIDETLSLAIIKNGFWGLIHDCFDFQATSPLYFYILKAATNLFGISEVSMRIPSLIFALFSSVVWFDYIKKQGYKVKLVQINLIVLCTGFFLSYNFIDARPYSLALLLAIIGFYIGVNNRICNSKFFSFYLASIWALAFYAHYFSIFLILPNIIFLRHLSHALILRAIIFYLILVLPMFSHIYECYLRSDYYAVESFSDSFEWLSWVAPSELIWILIVNAIAALIVKAKFDFEYLYLGGKGIFISLIVVFQMQILGILSGHSFFIDRYLSFVLPGWILMCTSIVLFVKDKFVQLINCLILIATVVYSVRVDTREPSLKVYSDNFKQFSHCPFLSATGLVENRVSNIYANYNARNYLLARINYYNVPNKRIYNIPYGIGEPAAISYLKKIATEIENDTCLIIYQEAIPKFIWEEGFIISSVPYLISNVLKDDFVKFHNATKDLPNISIYLKKQSFPEDKKLNE